MNVTKKIILPKGTDTQTNVKLTYLFVINIEKICVSSIIYIITRNTKNLGVTFLVLIFLGGPIFRWSLLCTPSRPEGPRRCPGRDNAGGAFVFFATFGYYSLLEVTIGYYRLL